MSKKARAFRKNMLIVCEGEVTEPEYFNLLKKMSLEAGIWDEIDVKPKPRSEEEGEATVKVPSPHKSPKPRRQLKTVEVPIEADEVEQRYNWRQTPVSFVKEARGGLKDDTFVEVWAVFDCNGHPSHPQAFSLANELINGKKVNIAFSSIAFEHWILLHFEKNLTAFAKSECKQHGTYLDCGNGAHASDCWGSRCVVGYMRVNKYLSYSTKKPDKSFYALLDSLVSHERRFVAYKNVAWLRYAVPNNEAEPYLTNPYTNVDKLVKRLLNEDDETIEWISVGEQKRWQFLDIQLGIAEGRIHLIITNLDRVTRLFNGKDITIFSLKDNHREEWGPFEADDGLIPVGVTKEYYHQQFDDTQSVTIEIRTGTHSLFIAQ